MAKGKNNILLIILAVIVVLVLAKDLLIKIGVEQAAKAVTGMPLKIESLHVGLTSTKVDIKGLKVYNPKGFEEKLMVSIPEIYVDYELLSVFTGKVHVTDFRLHLEEFIVVKNKNGEVNLDHLKAIKEQKTSKAKKTEGPATKPQELQIDNLSLKLERVVYKDYSKGGEPSVKEFNIGIDQSYKDIKSLNAVVSIIVVRALAQTTIANLTNVDITGLSSAVSGTLKGASDTTKKVLSGTTDTLKGTTDTLKDTTESLKGMLKNPFGSKE
jgi:uncharacterized protein involved in outer membrane biogenesis